MMVFPEQSGIDTLGVKNKEQVEKDMYRHVAGMNPSYHPSGEYARHLIDPLRYYLKTDDNQKERYDDIIHNLEQHNNAIAHRVKQHNNAVEKSKIWEDNYPTGFHFTSTRRHRELAELVYQHDTNKEAIQWLKTAKASSLLTADAIVFGEVEDSQLKETVMKQITSTN